MPMRSTRQLRRVAEALLADPDGTYYGYDLTRKTGLRSGVVYPILHRLLDSGWVIDGWEERVSSGRPPRRFYILTDEGRRQLSEIMARRKGER